ncbi:phosphatases II [Serendipita vermifera]|nr:phosphatases II [Serendipita vermifera]
MASTSTTQLVDPSLFGPGSRQIAEIIPDFLYLSDIKCASDDALLAQAGFTHVISILSAPIPWLGPSPNSSCRVLNVKCDDSVEEDIIAHFEITNRFIEDAYRESLTTRKRNKVLCHCLAGVSRSPTVIAAYLMASRGMKRDEALDLLRERRGVVEPNPGFVEQLGVYEARVRKSKVMGFATSSSITHSTTGSASHVMAASSVGAVGTQGSGSPSGLVLNAITQRPRNHLLPHLTLSVASG